ncbi:MAG: flagellar basal body rod protein FlgB [Desulfohalobiaceae bacterium]
MKSIFSDYIHVASRGMDLRLERQNVVAGNLANISNPEYQPRRLEFEQEMQAALEMQDKGRVSKTSPEHMPAGFNSEGIQGSLSQEPRFRVIQGQDGVDLDQEMAVQNKNTLQYNTLALILQKSFTGLQDLIDKGGQ